MHRQVEAVELVGSVQGQSADSTLNLKYDGVV
jgi:hypothetical protein